VSWFRSYKIVLGLALFGLLLMVGLIPAYGDQLDSFKAQQKKVQQEMEQRKQLLKEKESQKRTFLGQLDALEKDMTEVQEDLGTLGNQLKNAEAQVSRTQKELDRTEEKLDQRMEFFKQRVKEVYLNGQVSYLELAFQATSVSDFLTRFDLLEKLVQQDVDLLDEIETQKELVAEKKAQLEGERNRIAEVKASTERTEKVLAQKQEQKKQLLTDVEQDKKKIEQALDELESLSNQLGEKIRKIQEERSRNSKNHFSGQFAWPTPGYTRITSPFGYRIHPILKTNRMHTGIDIGAPAGTSIHAADDGTVIFAGSLGAYGNATVIDHGDGISTMYAHQSQILVSENQDVKRGEVIGKVGSTGWATGPHLHFEVRKNGEPVSPLGYLQ